MEDSSVACTLASPPRVHDESDKQGYHNFDNDNDNDEKYEGDPDMMARSSLVEEQLLTFYDNTQKQLLTGRHSRVLVSATKSPYFVPPLDIIHIPHAYPCLDTHSRLPSHPNKWPQRPLMLRPSPRTPTKVRGIRHAHHTAQEYQHFAGFCAGCILPINTGTELPGQSLVIDFESNHFVGTLMMRILEAPPPPPLAAVGTTTRNVSSYFDGKKRRFQAVVKGKFKTPLSMSQCVTGQMLDRPAGKLPARWIVTKFIKFVSRLAPQLEVIVDGDRPPRFLTPLVATAHTVLQQQQQQHVQGDEDDENDDFIPTSSTLSPEDQDKLYNYQVYAGANDVDDNVEEPSPTDQRSVMQLLPGYSTNETKDLTSISARQQARKKAYNMVFSKHDEEPKFELNKEYTFEFYQHLLLFGESLALDMGRVLGKVDLAPVTDGQPIKFMAAHKDPATGELDPLWSFDIWHESLYEYARAAEEYCE